MRNYKHSQILEAILCSFSLMIFSFFIHYDFPVRIISFAALVVPAYIFGKNLQSFFDFRMKTWTLSSLLILQIYTIAGFLTGMLLAIAYRWYLGISLLPFSGPHYFIIVACMIGALEELIFRGFIQGYVKSFNAPFSVFFGSISHTGYKCCLFLAPLAAADINIKFLALWTFGAGLMFGSLKHFSNSIFPPLIAHVIFDLFVYAEFLQAPWWVW